MRKYHSHPTVYKGIQFKSTLEANFAHTLDQYNISWEYEPESLLVPGRAGVDYRYKPVFAARLEGQKIYIECKGFRQGLQKLRAYQRALDEGQILPPLFVVERAGLANLEPLADYLNRAKAEGRSKKAFDKRVKQLLVTAENTP